MARLRHTYKLWEQGRGNLVRLPSSDKTFRNLTVHLWRRGAGKGAYRSRKHQAELAQAVAEAVAEVGAEILVVYRKVGGKRFEDMVRRAVERRCESPPQLHFLTWGKHQATNEYADIKHVILVGALHYSAPQVEVLGRAAGGVRADEPLSEQAVCAVERGETAHHIWQAAGRGALRKTIDGDCPPGCRVDIIDGTKDLPALVRDLFPGASVKQWRPMRPLTPRQARIMREIARVQAEAEAAMDLVDDEGRVYPELGYALDGPPVGVLCMDDLTNLPDVSRATVFRFFEDPRVGREFARRGITVDRHPWPAWAPGLSIRRTALPLVFRDRDRTVRWEPVLKHVQRVTS